MSDSGFKLRYSWEDLRPVHPLVFTVLIAEVLGAIANLVSWGTSNWVEAVWFGGALATFPGFLVGLFLQSRARPGSISVHRPMVVFIGAITLLLFVAGLTFPRAAG